MPQKDQLAPLILSLTPTEKKYFVQFTSLHGNEKSYLKLYQAVLKHGEYNAEKLSRELKKTKANLAHEKEYLFENILKALRLFHDKTPAVELNNRLSNLSILQDRKLYPAAQTQLTKAQKLAATHSRTDVLWELGNHQNALSPRLLPAPYYFKEYETTMQQMQQHADWISALTQLQNIHWQIALSYNQNVYLTDKKQQQQTKKWLRHPVLTATYAHPLLQYMQADLLSSIYEMLYDKTASLHWWRKVVTLADKHPVQLRMSSRNYFAVVQSLAVLLLADNQLGELEKLLTKIKTRYYRHLPFDITYLDQMFYAHSFTNYLPLYQIQVLEQNKNHAQARELFKQMAEKEADIKPYLDEANWITLQTKAARLAFLMGEDETSFYWLKKIIHENNPAIAADSQATARMLLALAHAQEGSYGLLPHLVQTARRYYKNHTQNISDVEQITFSFLLKLGTLKTTHERKAAFAALLKQYQELEKTEAGKRSMRMLNYKLWVKRNL